MSAHDPHPARSRACPENRRRSVGLRRAFTLVEAAVSIALTTILLSVVGVAITQSISAAERGVDLNQRSRQAAEVFDQISAELSVATTFTTRTSTVLEFTIPDMTSAGADPVIRYEWSGRSGDPLMRTYNAKAATPVLSDVRTFSFLSLVRPGPLATTSQDRVLHAFDDPGGETVDTYAVGSKDWAAAYVRPTLPGLTTSWSISRVAFRASRDKAGTMTLQVRAADANRQPTGTVLATTSTSISSLGTTAGWRELPIAVTGLRPDQGVCLVFSTTGAGLFNLEFVDNTDPGLHPNCAWMSSQNTGSSWTAADDRASMFFKLGGTVTMSIEQPPQ